MKPAPRPGTSRLDPCHANSDHRSQFGLNWENLNPQAVQVAERMFETRTVGGFALTGEPLGRIVWVDQTKVSSNTVTTEGKAVTLMTAIVPGGADICQESLGMAADLEQCAAIAPALDEDHAQILPLTAKVQ
jgi:hypothetical protein